MQVYGINLKKTLIKSYYYALLTNPYVKTSSSETTLDVCSECLKMKGQKSSQELSAVTLKTRNIHCGNDIWTSVAWLSYFKKYGLHAQNAVIINGITVLKAANQ